MRRSIGIVTSKLSGQLDKQAVETAQAAGKGVEVIDVSGQEPTSGGYPLQPGLASVRKLTLHNSTSEEKPR